MRYSTMAKRLILEAAKARAMISHDDGIDMLPDARPFTDIEFLKLVDALNAEIALMERRIARLVPDVGSVPRRGRRAVDLRGRHG